MGSVLKYNETTWAKWEQNEISFMNIIISISLTLDFEKWTFNVQIMYVYGIIMGYTRCFKVYDVFLVYTRMHGISVACQTTLYAVIVDN